MTSDASKRWRIGVLVSSVVALALTHGPLIGYRTFANVDEAYAGALASRLLDGFKLYQGAVSQRGPLMYYAFEGIAWLHGWDDIVALRAWGLALAIAHVLLVYWAGRALFSRSAATIAAAIAAYALAFGFPAEDGVAVNGESLQLPALLVGVVLGAIALRTSGGSRARLAWLAASGVSFGAAIAIKQSVLLHPLALAPWIVADAHRQRAKASRAAIEIAALIAATSLVPALFLAHAAHEGTLRELFYYCYTYNRDVHLAPTKRSLAWLPFVCKRMSEEPAFFFAVGILTAIAAPRVAARVRAAARLRSAWALVRGFGAAEYVALHLVLALFAASAALRFFPHYYLHAASFLALAFGHAIDRAARAFSFERQARRLVTAFASVTFLAAASACWSGERADGRVMHDATVQDASRAIEARTSAGDRIFVWGFSPWLYGYSHRKPAGRFVFETYVTGFVPWFWEKPDVERARIVPGSQEALLADLDRERPAIVVDAGSVMIARSMRGYERTNAWLHAHYCFEVRVAAFDLYRRKTSDAETCASTFPKPHAAVDWNGHALEVSMPPTLDVEESRDSPERSAE